MKKSIRILSSVCILALVLSFGMIASAAVVNPGPEQYNSGRTYGYREAEWNDSSTRGSTAIAMEELFIGNGGRVCTQRLIGLSKEINRVTAYYQAKYSSTGNNIGGQVRKDAYNFITVTNSGNINSTQKVSVYGTMETQYTTATCTYINLYQV